MYFHVQKQMMYVASVIWFKQPLLWQVMKYFQTVSISGRDVWVVNRIESQSIQMLLCCNGV